MPALWLTVLNIKTVDCKEEHMNSDLLRGFTLIVVNRATMRARAVMEYNTINDLFEVMKIANIFKL